MAARAARPQSQRAVPRPRHARARALRRAAAAPPAGGARRPDRGAERRCRPALRAWPLPVAYFPIEDFADGVLRETVHRTQHPDLGETTWFEVAGDSRSAPRGAWQHTDLPAHAALLKDKVALAWRAMDAFYEEDDRILGHAADPYHRIDIRHGSRHLVVRAGDRVVADTVNPLVLYESGFAPRWYVPRADVVADALTPVELQTFCPYKGIAFYYDIDGVGHAAWSYRAPFDDMAAIGDMVSFEPDRVEVTLDGERLETEPGQTVVSHGIDRDLSIGEAGLLSPRGRSLAGMGGAAES